MERPCRWKSMKKSMTSYFHAPQSNKPLTLSQRIKKKYLSHSDNNISFLSDDLSEKEIIKIMLFVDQANKIIKRYFGVKSTFCLIICNGELEMQSQIMSKIRGGNGIILRQREHQEQQQHNFHCRLNKVVAMTDYMLKEIIIRNDIAKFGNYLHELIHGVLDISHTYHLREALAWYYMLKLTEQHKYARPSYPIWIEHVYIAPVRKLVLFLVTIFKQKQMRLNPIESNSIKSSDEGSLVRCRNFFFYMIKRPLRRPRFTYLWHH